MNVLTVRQNQLFAFPCRFIYGKLRLIKHSDLIVAYDEGEYNNLFDFGEPENAAIDQHSPLVGGSSTYLRPSLERPSALLGGRRGQHK